MPRSSSSSQKSITPVPNNTSVFRNPYSSVGITSTPSAPSLGQSIKEGFGLGAGSAIAHRVVTSILGAPTVTLSQPAPEKKADPCERERTAFENCMKTQSIDTFCGQEQLSYTECIRMSKH